MGLSSFSINRPITILMLFFGVILIGLVCFSRLPVELMPNVSFGEITIIVEVRGGIPPSEVEKRVTKPIEEAVGTVTHIKDMLSISKEGRSTITLEFEPGTNMDFAALEVREKFARIRNKLPPEIEKPVIAKYEYLDVPIMILAVTAQNYSPEELRRIVDDSIKDRIARLEGVPKVEVSGGRERKILVEVDQARLSAHSLSIERVIDILNLSNLNLLAGDIKRGESKFLVRAMGEFESLQEIAEIGIATTPTGSIIRLKDVAEVADSYLDPTAFARVNTQPVVSLYVLKESLANTVKVAGLIEEELKEITAQFSNEKLRIIPTSNQAEFVKKAVDTVKNALLLGGILAISVLWIFLRSPRSTLIIAFTIPISVLATFSIMHSLGITLNVMTLSGLAMGIGMLVDNAIVVLENIFKKRENVSRLSFHAARKTAVEGAREVTLAIIASTITTIVIFLPIIFVSKEIQMLYSGLALTVIFSLLASLFVALTLVPMLAAKIRTKKAVTSTPNPPTTFAEGGGGQPLRSTPLASKLRKIFGLLRGKHLTALKYPYGKALHFVIRFRYVFIILAFSLFAHAISLSTKLEKEFIGIAEQNKFTVFIELPTGTRLEVTDEKVSQVEELLSKVPEVKTATARVEPWSSKVYVELVGLNKRKRSTGEIIESLRPGVRKIRPAFVYFEEPQEVGTKEILLELYGYDYGILKQLAMGVASSLQTIPRLTDIKIRMREGRPEMHLKVDKQRAALFGFSVGQIAEVVHAQMRGLVATRYHTPVEPLVRLKDGRQRAGSGEFLNREKEEMVRRKMKEFFATHLNSAEAKEVETITRLQEEYRRTFGDLHQLILTTPTGEQVYLKQLTAFKFDIGPSEIWRKNKFRMVQVSANTGGMALGTVAGKIKESLINLKFPKDYFWRFGGNYDKMIRNQKELTFALCLTLILVFMVLASLFESYYQPFIIMISVPLAAIGVVSILTLTDKPVGIGVLIGAMMLAGIVVNNAIILVDKINHLRKGKGASQLKQVVIRACQDRLRPILMTTSTTLLGLLPMALDTSEAANLWAPLAITVIGGLLSSTLLTLFILPSIYLAFNDLRNIIRRTP